MVKFNINMELLCCYYSCIVRVKPVITPPIKASVLSTTVQWVFRLNVDDRIYTFRVICRDGNGSIMNIGEKLIMKNVAEFKNDSLEPNTTYYVKVAAVYNDGFEAESENEFAFRTPGGYTMYVIMLYIIHIIVPLTQNAAFLKISL